jgi:hypothetical protein
MGSIEAAQKVYKSLEGRQIPGSDKLIEAYIDVSQNPGTIQRKSTPQ